MGTATISNLVRCATVLGCLIAATTATAGQKPGHLIVGADIDRGGSTQLDGPAPVSGAGLRIGYGVDMAIIELIPEGRLMMYGEPNHRYGTAEFGGRIMFLKILEPGLFARVLVPVGGGGPGVGITAGGVLDFTAIPVVDIGLHGGFVAGVKGTTGLGGAHVSLNF